MKSWGRGHSLMFTLVVILMWISLRETSLSTTHSFPWIYFLLFLFPSSSFRSIHPFFRFIFHSLLQKECVNTFAILLFPFHLARVHSYFLQRLQLKEEKEIRSKACERMSKISLNLFPSTQYNSLLVSTNGDFSFQSNSSLFLHSFSSPAFAFKLITWFTFILILIDNQDWPDSLITWKCMEEGIKDSVHERTG